MKTPTTDRGGEVSVEAWGGVRHWLIRRLAGSDSIAINLHIRGQIITTPDHGVSLMGMNVIDAGVNRRIECDLSGGLS